MIRYEDKHIYQIVEISRKIICYSNVSWIDNETAVKRKSFPELLALTPKHQRSNFSLNKNQKASSMDKSLIFANFRFFKLTQDFFHLSQSTLQSHFDFILSSALSSSESLNQTFLTITNLFVAYRPVTYLQDKIFAERLAFIASDQPFFISLLQLFSFLFTTNNAKPIEPKTYK